MSFMTFLLSDFFFVHCTSVSKSLLKLPNKNQKFILWNQTSWINKKNSQIFQTFRAINSSLNAKICYVMHNQLFIFFLFSPYTYKSYVSQNRSFTNFRPDVRDVFLSQLNRLENLWIFTRQPLFCHQTLFSFLGLMVFLEFFG